MQKPIFRTVVKYTRVPYHNDDKRMRVKVWNKFRHIDWELALRLVVALMPILFSAAMLKAQQNCKLLCNSDFEDKQFMEPYNSVYVHDDSMPCWSTSASDSMIEVWTDGFNGVNAYSGNQFLELNANEVSTLFQNFTAYPGETVRISFAHRGRLGLESLSVSIGPVGGPYIALDTFTTGTSAWNHYTLSYTFPNNGVTSYSIRFNSMVYGTNTMGNFLDAIQVYLNQPQIAFNVRNDSCGNSTGSIEATISSGTPPYVTLWSNNATGTKIDHMNAGRYSLMVTDANGCTETLSDTLTDIKVNVLKALAVNKDRQCFNRHQFNFSTESYWKDCTFEWDFGDGTTSNSGSFAKQYEMPGNYTVTLIGTMHLGCKDTLTRTVNLWTSPIARIWSNDTAWCMNSQNIYFKSLSTSTLGRISMTRWSFGDKTFSNSSSVNNKRYTTAGTYPVTLVVSNDYGCMDTAITPIYLYRNPVAKFTINHKEACLNWNLFQMRSESQFFQGKRQEYWKIKSPQVLDSGQSFNYSSRQTGTQKIVLKCIDEKSCTDSMETLINIYPQSQLSFKTDTVCVGYSNFFNSKCTINNGKITVYIWQFSDGGEAYGAQTSYKFAEAGAYTVSLITRTDKDCLDTLTGYGIAVARALPTVDFSYQKNTGDVFPQNFSFKTLRSSSSQLTYLWDFNHSEYSTLKDPDTRFKDTGMIRVSLKATDVYGCTGETVKLIANYPDAVLYLPNAFAPNDDRLNDTYKVYGMVWPQKFKMEIYNRWGELLFETKDHLEGWDGRYQGEKVCEGVYLAIVYFEDLSGKSYTYRQTVTVLR